MCLCRPRASAALQGCGLLTIPSVKKGFSEANKNAADIGNAGLGQKPRANWGKAHRKSGEIPHIGASDVRGATRLVTEPIQSALHASPFDPQRVTAELRDKAEALATRCITPSPLNDIAPTAPR